MTKKNDKPFSIYLSEKLKENGNTIDYTSEEIQQWITDFWTSPQIYDPNFLRVKMELWKECFVSMLPLGLKFTDIAQKCDYIVAKFDETFNSPPESNKNENYV